MVYVVEVEYENGGVDNDEPVSNMRCTMCEWNKTSAKIQRKEMTRG